MISKTFMAMRVEEIRVGMSKMIQMALASSYSKCPISRKE